MWLRAERIHVQNVNWGRKQSHADWVKFQQGLIRRPQSTDLWALVVPFRDTGYHVGNSKANPRSYILVGVGLLIDRHAGELELA